MKVVIYSQQGNDTLSGIHSDIVFDFCFHATAFVVKSKSGEIYHFISCKDVDTIGIWQANELDKRKFISACKAGKLIFMIVPDDDEEEEDLQHILQNCVKKIPN